MVLRAERQSAQMSEIKNGTSGLSGAEHSKCNHMMTVRFKGLTHSVHCIHGAHYSRSFMVC